MKASCQSCGAHFPEEFKKTLNCLFWEQRGLQLLSEEDKKKVWDWFFGFPFDEFAERTKIALEVEIKGVPYYGNFFEKNLSFYDSLSDKERRELQKDWLKFISKLESQKQTAIIMGYFLGKSKKWLKYLKNKNALE